MVALYIGKSTNTQWTTWTAWTWFKRRKHPDVLYRKTIIFLHDIPHIGDVVDASLEVGTGHFIFIDANKKGSIGHDVSFFK